MKNREIDFDQTNIGETKSFSVSIKNTNKD